MRILLLLCLAATTGGCSLVVSLDEFKPGEGDDPDEKMVQPVIAEADLTADLQGTWTAECVDEADPQARFTLTLTEDADGDLYVDYERTEKDVGCGEDLWTEYVSGKVESITPDALGYGDDAVAIEFTLESAEAELSDGGEVDVSAAWVEGDTYMIFMVLDAAKVARLSAPSSELSDHLLPGSFELP